MHASSAPRDHRRYFDHPRRRRDRLRHTPPPPLRPPGGARGTTISRGCSASGEPFSNPRASTACPTIPQQVDYHLVRAEMNGLDFDHRVLEPWANNPAFDVTVFLDESDQSARVPALDRRGGRDHHRSSSGATAARTGPVESGGRPERPLDLRRGGDQGPERRPDQARIAPDRRTAGPQGERSEGEGRHRCVGGLA